MKRAQLIAALGAIAAITLAGAAAQGSIVIAQYNFGQAGPTTAPSGDFAAVTAGDATAWGGLLSFNPDNNPGPDGWTSQPV